MDSWTGKISSAVVFWLDIYLSNVFYFPEMLPPCLDIGLFVRYLSVTINGANESSWNTIFGVCFAKILKTNYLAAGLCRGVGVCA